ncbi:hypothetical protein I4U23_027161 [Adineta vaga]|nr:hypothetical protein I4U23_027161 [Adineta vaga]
MQWFLKITLLCLFILWILGVLTSFIFTFLPRNEETGAASIGFTDEATSTIVNLNYDTDVTNNGSLVVTNLLGLADQIAKTYSVSRNMVRVFSARFIQSLILTRKKRQSTSVANNTNIRTKLQLVIETQFIYPRSCGGVKICNDRFINSIRNTIERIDSEVPFTVSLTNGNILNINVVFQSFDRTTSTPTTTTTTTTTDTTSTSATTSTTTTATTTTTTTTIPPGQ